MNEIKKQRAIHSLAGAVGTMVVGVVLALALILGEYFPGLQVSDPVGNAQLLIGFMTVAAAGKFLEDWYSFSPETSKEGENE